jgi:dephospho-CoA kinase
MFVIGLTGGIGTGKTQVSNILKSLGATAINADQVGHEAYLPHTDTWREVVAAFGEDILDSDEQIVRAKLGAIVFSDPAHLQKLNSIVHPRIYDMISDRIESLSGNGVEVAVVEAALLIEANWTPLADEVWVVTSPRETVLSRLLARGMTPERAESIIESQMPQDEREEYADAVIDNDSGLPELEKAVRENWESRIATRIEQGD